jgi:hypothetical protein
LAEVYSSSAFEAEDVDCDEARYSETDDGDVFLGFGQMSGPQVRHLTSFMREHLLTDHSPGLTASPRLRRGIPTAMKLDTKQPTTRAFF